MPNEFNAINRRDIIKLGSVLPMAVMSAIAGGTTTDFAPIANRIIYDARFAAARRFARDALARKWPITAFHGDITDLWYDDLSVSWRNADVIISGCTTKEALFCLERLGWDVGLRVTRKIISPDKHLITWSMARLRPTSRPVSIHGAER